MGKIFYVMGKSSSGKDSIYKKILEKIPSLHKIVLYTTRPIREGEKDGVAYHFVSQETCELLKKQKKIIELRSYDTIHGVWNYFTVNDDQIDLDQNNYLVIGTLESYEKMRDFFGKEFLEPIYIEVEDGIRLERALAREKMERAPKYEELCRRFLADTTDFSDENIQSLGIQKRFLNIDIEKCIEEISLYIEGKI